MFPTLFPACRREGRRAERSRGELTERVEVYVRDGSGYRPVEGLSAGRD